MSSSPNSASVNAVTLTSDFSPRASKPAKLPLPGNFTKTFCKSKLTNCGRVLVCTQQDSVAT